MRETQNMSLDSVVKQVEGNIVSDMDGEKVMLNMEKSKYYNLGEIGGTIWERIESPVSIQALIDTLTNDYDVDQNECEADVISFLGQLLQEGLIHVETVSAS